MDERRVGWAEARWLECAGGGGRGRCGAAGDRAARERLLAHHELRLRGDSGHALLTDFPAGTSVQVGFVAAFEELYDQAGLPARADERTWGCHLPVYTRSGGIGVIVRVSYRAVGPLRVTMLI